MLTAEEKKMSDEDTTKKEDAAADPVATEGTARDASLPAVTAAPLTIEERLAALEEKADHTLQLIERVAINAIPLDIWNGFKSAFHRLFPKS